MNVSIPPECLICLRDNAEAADRDPVWPAVSWQALDQAGVLRWEIDPALGGCAADALTILDGLEQIAAACLTTCFILSQRQAAVRRIADMATDPLRSELLPSLASGRSFATVGLSQLTTSRQHGQTSLLARAVGEGFVLDGVIPWVTGAAACDTIVTGAPTAAGEQVF
ncbi:MAG: acyl-CoA dehydrogenase family protein, partial [Planctomycetota bacterium]